MQFRTNRNGIVYPLKSAPRQVRKYYADKQMTKQKWFKDEEYLEGWHKDQSEKERHHELIKAAEKHGWAKTFHTLLGLHNVTKDMETKRKAKEDYEWVAEEHGEKLHKSLSRER